MAPTVLETVPVETQEKLLRVVLANPHPKLALGSIAANHQLTMDQLRTILNHHGYPDVGKMRRSIEQLAIAAAAPADEPTDTAVVAQRPGMRRVKVTDLHADADNLRGDVGDITELAESIVAVGLLQPIVVREHGGRLVVVAGHRRLAAIRKIGWEHVDVIVRPPMRPDEVIAAMLIENGQRKDLDPIEEARGLARLAVDAGLETQQQIASRIGRTQMYVSNRLALLALTPEEQEQVRSGELSIGAATEKARINSGRVKPTARGKKSAQHLSVHHELGTRAQARCTAKGHKRNGAASVGGIACGECWESVIRADERASLHTRSARLGSCVLCDTVLTQAAES